jgi:hypothetical protein
MIVKAVGRLCQPHCEEGRCLLTVALGAPAAAGLPVPAYTGGLWMRQACQAHCQGGGVPPHSGSDTTMET